MAVRRTGQASYCVSLTEAKEHLRLETPDHDKYLLGLLGVVHEYAQARLGRALTRCTYELTLSRFPTDGRRPIELPYPPVYLEDPRLEVLYRQDGVVTVLDDVQLVPDDLPPKVYPPPGKSWPMLSGRDPDTVLLRWQAGYDFVPPQIKHACLMLLSHYFEQRSAVADRPGSTVPLGVDVLFSSVSTGYYAPATGSPYASYGGLYNTYWR